MKKITMFEAVSRSYNLDCNHVDLPGTNASLMGCVLAPGETSEGHNHIEDEIFIFAYGHGRVEANGEVVDVNPGDAVLFSAFENHVITNISMADPLGFHSVYWDGTAHDYIGVTEGEKDLLIFSTPPTPNGDLHLGHLSGPYLAGDVQRRIAIRSGRSVRHITGRDDHQTYVVVCAERDGISAEDCASRYAEAIRGTWDAFGIDIDGFIAPTRQGAYADFVREGLFRLYQMNLVAEETAPVFFDASGRQAHEGYIWGRCPHCDESSDGNACEACGRPNKCVDLGEARAKDGSKIKIQEHKHLVFRLSSFSDRLAQYVKTANMPAHVLALSLNMIRDGLSDIAISHRSDWGIQNTLSGFENQSIYVWFEMAFGYLWAAGANGQTGFDKQIAAAANVYDGSDIIHCYGFDNAFYHTLLFPAIYMALGIAPPSTHVVNELLDLDGAKFSTSRRHLIWGSDLIRAVPTDYARYMLISRRPEGRRGNFVMSIAVDEVNSLFAEKLREIIVNFTYIAEQMDGEICEPGAWLPDQRRFLAFLDREETCLRDSASTNGISPRMMARCIRELVEECAAFQSAQAWLFVDHATFNYARTAQALVARALLLIVRATDPLMPQLSEQLRDFLNLDKSQIAITAQSGFISGGRQVCVAAIPLLPRLPSDVALKVLPNFSPHAISAPT